MKDPCRRAPRSRLDNLWDNLCSVLRDVWTIEAMKEVERENDLREHKLDMLRARLDKRD